MGFGFHAFSTDFLLTFMPFLRGVEDTNEGAGGRNPL